MIRISQSATRVPKSVDRSATPALQAGTAMCGNQNKARAYAYRPSSLIPLQSCIPTREPFLTRIKTHEPARH